MFQQPLSLRVEQRRPAVVVDPELVLGTGPLGLLATRMLSRTFEVWLVPELWQILDNTCRWRDEPGLLLPGREPELVRGALDACERWRSDTDAIGLGCFFVGHRGGESLLPDGADPTLPERWQTLARQLEQRAHAFPLAEPLAAAWRDALALSVALPAAPILTLAPHAAPPGIARALSDWGLAMAAPAPRDPLRTSERRQLREFCAAAGAAKLAWAGLRLAVLHLVAPGTAVDSAWAADTPGEGSWNEAKAFWYRL